MSAMPSKNPFAPNHVIDPTASLPSRHVPELHKPTLDTIHRLVRDVQASDQPTSLLVVGEAGSGKSHLITQLRQDLRADPNVLVVTVPLLGATPGRLWRHIRDHVASDLLREEDGQASGLRRLLVARYPQWGQVKSTGGLIDIFFPPSAPKLNALTANDVGLVPGELRAVLPKLFESATRAAASDWLRGDNQSDDALSLLGLKAVDCPDSAQEDAARKVVLTLCKLAGKSVTLVIVFDNLETIQTGTTDPDALLKYAWVAGELATGSGPRLVVTFARPQTVQLLQGAGDLAAWQRISANEGEIAALGSWDHVTRIVTTSYDSFPEWVTARQHHSDPYWPLSDKFLRDLLAKNRFSLTPRHLLGACRTELQRIITGPRVGPPPPPPPGGFDRVWAARRARYFAEPSKVAFDPFVGIGLPWLQEVAGAGLERVAEKHERLDDVTLLFARPGSERLIGVSACHHPPAQFFRRIDRLRKQWAEGRKHHLSALVLVRRDDDKALTDVGRKRWETATAEGITTLALPPQQFAELAAYQELFSLTQNGAFMDEGRPVSVAEYQAWAASHLSQAVKELADTLFGPRGEVVPLVVARKDKARAKA